MVPASFPVIRRALFNRGVIGFVLINYVIRLFFNIIAVATPIVTIAAVKPVRLAVKNIFKKICVCCNDNEEEAN